MIEKVYLETWKSILGHSISYYLQYYRQTNTPWAQDAKWTYIRRSEDVPNIFWTSYVRLIYALCPEGNSGTENIWEEKDYLYYLSLAF